MRTQLKIFLAAITLYISCEKCVHQSPLLLIPFSDTGLLPSIRRDYYQHDSSHCATCHFRFMKRGKDVHLIPMQAHHGTASRRFNVELFQWLAGFTEVIVFGVREMAIQQRGLIDIRSPSLICGRKREILPHTCQEQQLLRVVSPYRQRGGFTG